MMKKLFALAMALMLCAAPALAQEQLQEGYKITAAGVDITLWENASTGYQWSYELDDPTLLTVSADEVVQGEAMPGAPSMHVWHFAGQGDGEALITFYYEQPWENEEDAEAAVRTVCFTVFIEGGKVVECEMEDLSEADSDGDGEDWTTYEGETGGVPVEILIGMTEKDTEEGKLFTSEDGMTAILINYEKDENPEELFEQLKDDESAAAIYDDEANGVQVISCSVDREADIPCVTMVYYTNLDIVEYTGYAAPNGGVLHVHTTYSLSDEETGYEGDEAVEDAGLDAEEPAAEDGALG